LKASAGIVLLLLLGATPILVSDVGVVLAAPKVLLVPDEHPTIQEAVDAANPGDIVYVVVTNYV
jgi:hypothetical protein